GGITLLALVDAALHFALDFILFRGQVWGDPFANLPPGATPPPQPLPLPLNELFVLNAVGYLVLVVAFWLAPRWLGRWSWLVSLAILGYAVAAIVGWMMYGKPNPNGLGYTSKAIEVVLVLIAAGYAWRTARANAMA
ncbi:MAG TPA: hypothetical protein VGK54_18645, partial [Chloroflexota bacterium]